MANYYFLKDGQITDSSTYGMSIPNVEKTTNTSGYTLTTSDSWSVSLSSPNTDVIDSIAVHLSSRVVNPVGTLTLSISSRTVSPTVVGTYPISSFTSIDGSHNTIAAYPLNWQLLKLSSPFANTTEIFKINLKTSNSNELTLMGLSTINGIDYDRMAILSKPITQAPEVFGLGTSVLTSVSPFTDGSETVSRLFNGSNGMAVYSPYAVNPYVHFAGTPFTVEGWFNINFEALPNTIAVLVGAFDTGASTTGWLLYVEKSTRRVLFRSANGASTHVIVTGTTALQSNVWYHIAAASEGTTPTTSRLRIFVDGQLEATSVAAVNIALGTLAALSYLNIGRNATAGGGTGSAYLVGAVSNVRIIYNKCLYINPFIRPQTALSGYAGPGVATACLYNNPYSEIFYKNSIPDDIHIGSTLNGYTTQNRTITADSATVNNIYIHKNGVFTFPNTPTNLTVEGTEGLQITSEGTIQVGTSDNPIPKDVIHNIILSNTQIDVHNGANLNVYGYPELTTTNLVSSHSIGSNTFTTTDNISSHWKTGDVLVFKPNISNRTSFDSLILNSFVAPNVFTTSSNSLFTHTGSADSFAFIPDVYNLSRNVIIQGLNNTSKGVIRTMGSSKTNINYTNLSNLGYNSSAYDSGLEIGHNYSGNFNLSGCIFNNNIQKAFNTSRLNVGFFGTTNLRGLSSLPSLGTGDFTMECWIYPTTIGSNPFVFDLNDTAMTGVRPTLYFNATNYLYRADTASGVLITSTVAPVANRWTHVAISRLNGFTKMFVNGVQTGSTYTDTKNYILGKPLIGIPADSNGNFVGYMSTIRLSFEGLYNSTFTPNFNLPNLPSTKLLLFSVPLEKTIIDSSSSKIPFNNTGVIMRTITRGISNSFNLNNTKINNNILSGTNLVFSDLIIPNSQVEVKNNYILSTTLTGNLQMSTLSGSINMVNNVIIGSLNYGTYLVNNNLTEKYGAINYNTALQGMMISGVNTGTIIGGSINSAREGVYVNASTSNLKDLTFENIIASNNSSVGFKVSGNSLNYLNPVILNINGLSANANTNAGLEGYNITGNINNLIMNGNLSGSRISIGNGPTIFDGLTSSSNGTVLTVLSALNYNQTIIKNALLSSLSPNSIALNIQNIDKLEEFRLEGSTLSANTPLLMASKRSKLEGSYLFDRCNSNVYGLSSIALNQYQPDTYTEIGLSVMNENGLSGNNFRYLNSGIISYDSSIVRTVGSIASEKLQPESSVLKLRSSSKLIPVKQGNALTVSVFIKKSLNYTGSAPRLMLRSNASLGYLDSVLTVSNSVNNVWELLTATLPASNNAGIFEIYVDCSGSSGSGTINIDDWDFS